MRYLLMIACAAVLVCSSRGLFDWKTKKMIMTMRTYVVVYYDVEDPESQRFFRTQLEPAWRKFPDAIRLKLVPYGRATREWRNGKWDFDCQRESINNGCFGNMDQACILNYPWLTFNQKLELIFCIMRQERPEISNSINTCVANKTSFFTNPAHPINLEPSFPCMTTTAGIDMLVYFGEQTDFVGQPLEVVPTVYINPRYDRINYPDPLALVDLVQAVCLTAQPRPLGCPPPSVRRDCKKLPKLQTL